MTKPKHRQPRRYLFEDYFLDDLVRDLSHPRFTVREKSSNPIRVGDVIDIRARVKHDSWKSQKHIAWGKVLSVRHFTLRVYDEAVTIEDVDSTAPGGKRIRMLTPRQALEMAGWPDLHHSRALLHFKYRADHQRSESTAISFSEIEFQPSSRRPESLLDSIFEPVPF